MQSNLPADGEQNKKYFGNLLYDLKKKDKTITSNTPLNTVVKKIGVTEVAKVILKNEDKDAYKEVLKLEYKKNNNKPTVAKSKPVETSILDESINTAKEAYNTATTKVKEAYTTASTTVKKELKSGTETVDVGVGKGIGEVLDLASGFSEDVGNIATYLKKGGGASSLVNFGKTLGGTEKKEASEIKLKKPLPKKSDYLVEGLEVSEGDKVSDGYSSKSFVLNLNRKNSFAVLDNTLDPKKIKNFKPVKGNILFTIQNDIDDKSTGRMPLTKITGDKEQDAWTKNSNEYVISMDNGSIKIKKANQLKKGDDVFKLKRKIFSMDDLDLKDGKIKVDYDDNLDAFVPVVKKSKNNTFKDNDPNIIIGLNSDKSKVSNGYIDLKDANSYGRKVGGSFIVFSDDLSQQYMVGGSFKNLYDFHEKLTKKYPGKKFKIFESDTGTYSNSVFPELGVIDNNIYKKSNTRNTWGLVQHLVLQN